jgi:hypothetical protein
MKRLLRAFVTSKFPFTAAQQMMKDYAASVRGDEENGTDQQENSPSWS